jgi:hypothetical protein
MFNIFKKKVEEPVKVMGHVCTVLYTVATTNYEYDGRPYTILLNKCPVCGEIQTHRLDGTWTAQDIEGKIDDTKMFISKEEWDNLYEGKIDTEDS